MLRDRGSHAPTIAVLAAAAGGGGALFALMCVTVHRTSLGVDRGAFDLFATNQGSLLARGVKLLADLGPPVAALFILVLLVVLVTRHRWRDASVIVVGFPLVAVVVHVAKSSVARPRPRGALIAAGGYSFPSAEAALSIGLLVIAVAIGGMVGRQAGRLVIGAAGLSIALIGVLLVSVRVHYLSDVFAGWALGTAVFSIVGAAALALGPSRTSPV